ncbi:radical SAM family heme chaperone HemW [bacterium]|nr:radical SAM family heme chaperone HemW [bacterium]
MINENIENLYIHIPFCRTRCPYCDFFSVKFNENYPFKKLLLKEIVLYNEKGYLKNIKNIYFGGGTPSVYESNFYAEIISSIGDAFNEVSIEINPEDGKNIDFLLLKSAGITRISLGIQTFNEDALKILGRNYSKDQIINTIERIRSNFENISFDRLIGIPFDSIKQLENDIELYLKYQPTHLSLYILTLNPTQERLITNRPDDDMVAELYKYAMKRLENKEFEHYEISNFAKNNKYCQYNVDVWNKNNYIGMGPGGVSTIENKRITNTASLKEYENLLNNNELPIRSSDILNNEDELFEYIMLGLRTKWGINTKKIKDNLNWDKIAEFKENGLIKHNNATLFLTDKGFLYYNYIVTAII